MAEKVKERIKFVPVINHLDLYKGFVKDGLLMSKERGKTNKCYLFIIGIEISYDTTDFREYNKFVLLPFPDQLINSEYSILYGDKPTGLVHTFDILRYKVQKIFEFKKDDKIIDRVDIFKLLGIDLVQKRNFIVSREYVDQYIER